MQPVHQLQVRTMVVEPDGGILIGGSFTNVNGVARPSMARLLGDPPVLLVAEGLNGAGDFVGRIVNRLDNAVGVEASADLLHWQPLSTNLLTRGDHRFSDPGASGPRRFYRAVVKVGQ